MQRKAHREGAERHRRRLPTEATALEGLLTGRIEGTGDRGPQLRFKLGGGGGINQHFGAPEERFVIAVEVFNHNAKE